MDENQLNAINTLISNTLHPDFEIQIGASIGQNTTVYDSNLNKEYFTTLGLYKALITVWVNSINDNLNPFSLLIKDHHKKIIYNDTLKLYLTPSITDYKGDIIFHILIDLNHQGGIPYHYCIKDRCYYGYLVNRFTKNNAQSFNNDYITFVEMTDNALKTLCLDSILREQIHNVPPNHLKASFDVVIHKIDFMSNTWCYCNRTFDVEDSDLIDY